MPQISFSAPAELADWLAGRADRAMSPESIDVRAKTELGVWREAQAVELRRTTWTLPELGYLAELALGSILTPGFGALLAAESADADPATAAKWGIDQQALTAQLAGLGPVQDFALRDALGRWVADPGLTHDHATWVALGVRVRDDTPARQEDRWEKMRAFWERQ